ncbi:MAG: glutamate synthase-related protein, partial [Bacteroidota bacterium]
MANNLRHMVKLRTDGGLHTGKEVVMAAILGAEEFDFGKLLLIAQGCIMARVCEKNTCPTGIATHNPRFKAKYKGTKEHIVKMMQYLAEDVQQQLAWLGVETLDEVIGRTDLLVPNEKHLTLIERKKLDLSFALQTSNPYVPQKEVRNPFVEPISTLNQQIVQDTEAAILNNHHIQLSYNIQPTDRAIPATLNGRLAHQQHLQFQKQFQEAREHTKHLPYTSKIHLTFTGSAGQSFCAYLTEHTEVRLLGEANDAVGKTMSGGKVIIQPHPKVVFEAEKNVIIGNVALYGATGGTLYVNGLAADRFAVRNSGATAVVEGVGLHACEYMTRGKVVILGDTSHNIGGGMTGGEVIVYGDKQAYVNQEYIALDQLNYEELQALRVLLEDYVEETASKKAQQILANWQETQAYFQR